MAYVPVPKDLNAVKTKVLFNLTKRQLTCFGCGAAIAVPLFFLCKSVMSTSAASIIMIKELDRNIVVDLIDAIYIHADKGVEIHFKFQDQHKRLMEFIDNNLAATRRAKIKAV